MEFSHRPRTWAPSVQECSAGFAPLRAFRGLVLSAWALLDSVALRACAACALKRPTCFYTHHLVSLKHFRPPHGTLNLAWIWLPKCNMPRGLLEFIGHHVICSASMSNEVCRKTPGKKFTHQDQFEYGSVRAASRQSHAISARELSTGVSSSDWDKDSKQLHGQPTSGNWLLNLTTAPL